MKRPAWLEEPIAPTLLLFAGFTVAGFVAIAIGWRVAARTALVAFQVPALVSGGIGGLALIFIGAGLTNIQVARRMAAAERADAEALLDDIALVIDARRSSA